MGWMNWLNLARLLFVFTALKVVLGVLVWVFTEGDPNFGGAQDTMVFALVALVLHHVDKDES